MTEPDPSPRGVDWPDEYVQAEPLYASILRILEQLHEKEWRDLDLRTFEDEAAALMLERAHGIETREDPDHARRGQARRAMGARRGQARLATSDFRWRDYRETYKEDPVKARALALRLVRDAQSKWDAHQKGKQPQPARSEATEQASDLPPAPDIGWMPVTGGELETAFNIGHDDPESVAKRAKREGHIEGYQVTGEQLAVKPSSGQSRDLILDTRKRKKEAKSRRKKPPQTEAKRGE
jgi:hypothetical protein